MYKYDRKGPKRGVALYSYSAEFGLTKTLEDCFEDVHDMGAHGIEILANTHIENYPYPTDEWVENWFRLCDKYEVVSDENALLQNDEQDVMYQTLYHFP